MRFSKTGIDLDVIKKSLAEARQSLLERNPSEEDIILFDTQAQEIIDWKEDQDQ